MGVAPDPSRGGCLVRRRAATCSDNGPVNRHPADEDTRPCDYCGHPVAPDSADEYDCPVCGDPDSR